MTSYPALQVRRAALHRLLERVREKIAYHERQYGEVSKSEREEEEVLEWALYALRRTERT